MEQNQSRRLLGISFFMANIVASSAFCLQPQYFRAGESNSPKYIEQLKLDHSAAFEEFLKGQNNGDDLAPTEVAEAATAESARECHKPVVTDLEFVSSGLADSAELDSNTNAISLAIEEQNCIEKSLERKQKSLWANKSRFFNILILGLDVPTRSQKSVSLEGLGRVPQLTSRADSINILSMDLATGKHGLFSIYRGATTPNSCWVNVARPSLVQDQIITNLFKLGNRKEFINCVREIMTERFSYGALAKTMNNRLGKNNRFEIHGLVEVDVNRLKSALTEVGFLAVRNLNTFTTLMTTADIGMSEIEQLSGVVDAMRNRHDWEGSGYQRAFNHTKFLTYSFGYLGRILSINSDFLSEAESIYEKLSSSLTLDSFIKLVKMPIVRDQETLSLADSFRFVPLLDRNGVERYVSPITIYQLGAGDSVLVYEKGQTSFLGQVGRGNFLRKVQTKWIAIPNPEKKESGPKLKHTEGRYLPD